MRRHHRSALRCYSWLLFLSLTTAVGIPTTWQPAAATTSQLTAVGGFEHTMVLYYLGPAVTDSNGNQSIFRLGSISDWLVTAGTAGY